MSRMQKDSRTRNQTACKGAPRSVENGRASRLAFWGNNRLRAKLIHCRGARPMRLRHLTFGAVSAIDAPLNRRRCGFS